MRKKGFAGSLSSANEVRTIEQSMWRNVTDAGAAVLFLGIHCSLQKFHDFLYDGLKMGFTAGFKGLHCVATLSRQNCEEEEFAL